MRKDRIKIKDNYRLESMCENCQFFTNGRNEGPGIDLGLCHRFPPNIVPTGADTLLYLENRSQYLPDDWEIEGIIGHVENAFPMVSRFDLCGEHKPSRNGPLYNLITFAKRINNTKNKE